MTIKEALSKINKTKDNESYVDLWKIADNEFNLTLFDWTDEGRFKAYFLYEWLCTDSSVGGRFYFFDGEPVAVSTQFGRKQSENFEWISNEAYFKVKEYILSFIEPPDTIIDLVDLDEEIKTEYSIGYYSQMYSKHKNNAFFDGFKVKVVDNKDSFNDGTYHPETIKIQFENGTTKWVEPKELTFKINLVD